MLLVGSCAGKAKQNIGSQSQFCEIFSLEN